MTKPDMITRHAVVKTNVIYNDKTQYAVVKTLFMMTKHNMLTRHVVVKRTLFIMTKPNMLTQHAVVQKNAIYYDKTL